MPPLPSICSKSVMVVVPNTMTSSPVVPRRVSVPAPISISSILVNVKTEKTSLPLLPITLSLPSPPSTTSTPFPAPSKMKSSSPLPPDILSLSSPPISRSRILEPVMVSLPARPTNLWGTSLFSATNTSSPAVPVTVLNTRIWKVAVSVAPILSCKV